MFKYCLAPALREFLFKANECELGTLDPQTNLIHLKTMCFLDLDFFLNGEDNLKSIKIIEKSIEGWNAVSHWDVLLIITNWKEYLYNWEDLAKTLGYYKTAKKINEYEG